MDFLPVKFSHVPSTYLGLAALIVLTVAVNLVLAFAMAFVITTGITAAL